jgi:predicted N-formylglutamate amidohydrolase
MSQRLAAPLIANEYSMGLIDVTRSLHHRALFPPPTRTWPAEDRQRLIDQIHTPYRQQIRSEIERLFSQNSYVIHLSIRTFPLRHSGKIRRADAGLLYDPSRDEEVGLCLDWIDEMYEAIPMLRVRRNYPRRGTTDSITKSMRSEFANRSYLGIEVLLNRAWAARPLAIRDVAIEQMCGCLQRVLDWSQSEAA